MNKKQGPRQSEQSPANKPAGTVKAEVTAVTFMKAPISYYPYIDPL